MTRVIYIFFFGKKNQARNKLRPNSSKHFIWHFFLLAVIFFPPKFSHIGNFINSGRQADILATLSHSTISHKISSCTHFILHLPWQAESWLKQLGAKEVLARKEMEVDAKALARETYAGCVDTVGDKVLANALSKLK